jgi:putative ABC transport system permease protein
MEEVFELEVYTEAYVTVEGAKELTEFTDAYDERIEEVKSAVEAIKEEREDARFDVLVQEVTEQVEESFAQYPAGMIPQEVIQETIDEQVEDLPTATWYVYDRDTLTEHSGYGENADRMKAIGKVFPVLFFLVAALISLTTMTRMVEEQRTQIGVYKALGYSRWKILQKYLWYAALATIFGSILGVLIGEKLLPYIIVTAYGIMYPHMGVVLVPYQPVYGLMAAGAALACTLLATFFACMKELHQQAAELMRPPAPKNGKRVFLEKVPFIWNRLNFTWKATVRNLIRYKKRFFMTLFGIGSCMALLLVGYGLKDSIFDIGVLQYKEIQLYDGLVILDEDASADEKEESYRLLSEQADVVDTMETYLQQVEIRKGDVHKDVNLNVAKEDADFERFVRFADRVSKESYHLDHKGAILTEKMATMLDVQVGDVVYLPHDKYGEVAVEIQAICENYLGHYLYMTKEYYEELYGEEPEYNSIYYTMKDGKEGKVRDVGEEIIETAGALSVSYTEDVQEQLDEMLGSLNIVMVVLVVSAGMLAFVVLYSLNNINITERARELATLKVLGFYDREVSSYVFRENILLTVLGAIVGIFLGQFLHRFIIVTVEVESAMFGRNIDPSSFVYSFLITMAFSLFVNLVMHAKLKRINMVESLKSVE